MVKTWLIFAWSSFFMLHGSWLLSKAKSIPTKLAWLNRNQILREKWTESGSFSHEAHFSCYMGLAIKQGKKYTNRTCLIEHELDFERNMTKIWLIFARSSFFMLIGFGYRAEQKVYQQNLPDWTRIRFWGKYGRNLTHFCMKLIFHANSIWLSSKANSIPTELAWLNIN